MTEKERRLALALQRVYLRWEAREKDCPNRDCPHRGLAREFAADAKRALEETGMTDELVGPVGLPSQEP